MVGHVFLAVIGLLCSVAALYAVTLMPGPQLKGKDIFENVLWGKLFIAATYASIAVVSFLAMTKVR